MSQIKNLTPKLSTPQATLQKPETSNVAKQQKTSSVTQPQLQPNKILSTSTPTKGDPMQRLGSIIENSKTSIGAIRQLFSSSVEQAKTDKAAGKGIIEGTSDFTKIVSEMQTLFSKHAKQAGYSVKQQQGMNADQLGAIASSYAREGIRASLIDGAATSLGVKPEVLANEGLFDLTRYNLDLFSGSEAAAMQGVQSAGTSTASVSAGASSTSTASGSASSAATGANLSGQILGGIGAAYSGYQLIANWGNTDPVSGAINGFTAGAYIGTMVGGPFGAAVGGAIGGIVGLASGFFGKSGKSEQQKARDTVRDFLRENGSISKDWKLTLADGSGYDIGKDGRFKLENLDGTKRHAYEIDFKHPLAGETVGMLQPIVALMTAGNPRLASDFTGYFTNAALSNAQDAEGARQNALAIYQSLKISPEQVVEGIGAMVQKGMITEKVGMAYLNGFASLLEGAKQATSGAQSNRDEATAPSQANTGISRNPRLKAANS